MSTEHLRAAAATRTKQVEHRATEALTSLRADGQPITFAAVARAAGISTDFLYRHPTIRAHIEDLRQQPTHPTPSSPTVDAGESSVVRALTNQLRDLKREHRSEVKHLHDALAAAHGENLRLRREVEQLGRGPAT